MGYTHYWRRPKSLPVRKFTEWAKDVEKIVSAASAAGVSLAHEYDEPNKFPTITSDLVRFNGIGDAGHETFSIERVYEPREWDKPEKGKYFDFCKTARKPYDLAVCAALIRLKHHFGNTVDVSSDGDAEDWLDGLRLCGEIFRDEKAVLPFREHVEAD